MEPMMLKLATKKNKRKKQVSDELFHFHDAEHVFLLFVAVFYRKSVT